MESVNKFQSLVILLMVAIFNGDVVFSISTNSAKGYTKII